ncbi:hypothetical protein DXG01_016368 [Tephrocybe rancida]|nr:hypothetical protein DXG01_016368 [Tephrocybe rancida]
MYLHFALVGLLLLFAVKWYQQSRGHRYPPVCQFKPELNYVLGNLLSIPLEYPWTHFAKIARSGDDAIYYHGLGNSILVLNSLESIHDLLINKGNTYSSRPFFVVASELMDLVKSTAFIPFGRRWRLHRKFSRIALNPGMVREYEGALSGVSTLLTKSLRQTPEAFVDHVRFAKINISLRAAGRVIMSTIYGIDVHSAEDQYISIAELAMDMISKAVIPGAYLVDLIPAMKYLPKWIPFTAFHQVGSRGRVLVAELIQKPFEHVKAGIIFGYEVAGTAKPSFTKDVLTKGEFQAERKTDDEFETTLKWASASIIVLTVVARVVAGQEVVSSSILNMIMAMATNPDKLKIAQVELSKVVGSRLITVDDRDHLPYVHAIIKETLRWHPPLPMAIARSSIEDDTYRGYLIPKNTIIIPNIWYLHYRFGFSIATQIFPRAIAHATDMEYPPEKFVPERFLGNNPPIDPSTYCFGFGRRYGQPVPRASKLIQPRICPGRMLAENAVFLMTANILKSFDIKQSVDKTGRTVPIRVQYSSGLVS